MKKKKKSFIYFFFYHALKNKCLFCDQPFPPLFFVSNDLYIYIFLKNTHTDINRKKIKSKQ